MSKTLITYDDQHKKKSGFYPQNKSNVKMDPQIYCHICGRVVANTHTDVLQNKDILEENDRFFQTGCIQRKLSELDIREQIKSMAQVAHLMREKAKTIMNLPRDNRWDMEQKLFELSELFFDNPAAFLYK